MPFAEDIDGIVELRRLDRGQEAGFRNSSINCSQAAVTLAFSVSQNAAFGLSGLRMAHNRLPPVPGQQFVEPMSRMGGDARENVGEPSLRIDAVHLARDDQAVHGRGALPAAIGARRTATIFCPEPSPVHSAHVGQELEVHYQWHPYFGSKVAVRRVEQRASGQFLKVLGPAGVVVSMAGWMLDPVICDGMSFGGPRVDLAALVELERLLIGAIKPAHCRSDISIVPEESDAVSQSADSGAGSADDFVIRQHPAGRAGLCGAGQDHFGVGSDPHAGGRPQRRGA